MANQCMTGFFDIDSRSRWWERGGTRHLARMHGYALPIITISWCDFSAALDLISLLAWQRPVRRQRSMKSMTLSIALATALLLQGCAGHPEERAFSEQERYQLSLESLSRQGLPYDDYVRQRASLECAHQAAPRQWVQLPSVGAAREG